MSSSFVKDCSNSSGSGSSNGNKTFIIIVSNNEGGQIGINENALHSLIASHGADPSQVSVMQMGGCGTVAAPEIPTHFTGNIGPVPGLEAATSGLPVMLDGYPTIPLEGSAVGSYAELPLDADALKRLESVLETEEAKKILGEPLLDIVNDPDSQQLSDQLESLIMPSDSRKESVSSNSNRKRAPPKRRSQRQMDKAEREEVEKILAENKLMLQKEREELRRKQEEEEKNEEEEEEDNDDTASEEENLQEEAKSSSEEKQEEVTKKKGKKINGSTSSSSSAFLGAKGGKGGKKVVVGGGTKGKGKGKGTQEKGKKSTGKVGGGGGGKGIKTIQKVSPTDGKKIKTNVSGTKKGGKFIAKATENKKKTKAQKHIAEGEKETDDDDEEEEEEEEQSEDEDEETSNTGGVSKGFQMKKLSVKVKKLNESLVKRSNTPEDIKSPQGELDNIPKITNNIGGQSDADNVRGVPTPAATTTTSPLPDNLSRDNPYQAQSSNLDIKNTETETGSKSSSSKVLVINKETAGKAIISNFINSRVQSNNDAVSQSNIFELNSNEVEFSNSEIKSTITSCGDDNLSGQSDMSSKSSCPILMPTQNFSDEAQPSVVDGSQAISHKLSSPETDFNNSINGDLLISEPRELKPKNKLVKNVEVLNPKEKSEVYVLNSVIARNLRDNLSNDATQSSNAKKPSLKSRIEMKKAMIKSADSRLNGGSNASTGKINKVKLKENEKPNILQQSPSISKSLMNYKIPLKNSANKRPLITHQQQNRPPEGSDSNNPLSPLSRSLSTSSSSTSSQNHNNTTLLSNSSKNTQHSFPLNKDSVQQIKPLPHPSSNKGSNNVAPKPPVKTSSIIKTKVSPPNNLSNLSAPVTSKKPPLANTLSSSSSVAKKYGLSNSNFNLQKNVKSIEKNKVIKPTLLTNVKREPLKLNKKTNSDSSDPQRTSSVIKKIARIYKGIIDNNKRESQNVTNSKSDQENDMSIDPSLIRRSGRPIKKKSFGDDILFLDEKTHIASDDGEHSSEAEDEKGESDKNMDAESGSEEGQNDSDEDNDVDDDPTRLWCICQEPHNNRFMICCDRCEDWFHGKCVGITKAMGKKMEEEEREWICPNCKKAERAIRGLTSPPKKQGEKIPKSPTDSPEIKVTKVINNKTKKNNKMTKKVQESPETKTQPRVLVYEKATGVVLSGTAAPTLNILQQWLMENPAYTTLQPAMMNSIRTDEKSGTKWIDLEEFGLKPEKTKKDRSFSFQEKIDSGTPTTKKNLDKNRKTAKFLQHSEVLEIAKRAQLPKGATNDPEAPVGGGGPKKKVSSSPSVTKVKKSNEKAEVNNKRNSVDAVDEAQSDDYSPDPKLIKDFYKDPALKKVGMDKAPQKPDMNVRNSVRKMLYDALEKRKSEVPNEFKDLTDQNLKELCKEIEEHLYQAFNKDVGFKYKSRNRSLVFNIKDTKNSGLFRKILNRRIPPEKLAYMTSEELASKELAEWREREEKKELEAIQKHELERIALGNQYIMKSHKGEIVIDKDEINNKNKDTESVISLAPDASKVASEHKPPEEEEDEVLANHKNHIYDPTCKICAAKELEEFPQVPKDESWTDKEKDKGHEKERRKSSVEDRRESDSSSHHSKHKKRDKERERRHSHKSKERERSRHRSRERDKDTSRHSKERDRHREERHSRDDKKKREDRKRRHSESRKEDRKRKESDASSSHRRKDSESDGKEDVKSKSRDGERKSSHEERRKEGKESSRKDISSKSEEKRKGKSYEAEMNGVSTVREESDSKTESNSTAQNSPRIEISHNSKDLSVLSLPPFNLPLDGEGTAKVDSSPKSPLVPDSISNSPSYRSPLTPPLPIEIDEEDLLSPATPPLPEEDRLTPPPIQPTQKNPIEKLLQVPIWKGLINMPDVAKFSAAAFEVSGKAVFFTGDVPSIVEIVGRINPDTVWTYIAQMKKSGSKEILVVRFQPSSEEEKVSYIALYSYLSSKKRYGVIGNCEKSVKDFYVVPLASHQPIPQVLLPLDGPGFEESRPHMLIGVIVRTKHRRIYDPLSGTWTNISESPQQKIIAKVPGKDSTADPDEAEGSFTPPPNLSPKPAIKKQRKSSIEEIEVEDDDDSVFTPSPLSTDGIIVSQVDLKEDKADRESMLEELNRQIERDKQELSEMQKKMDEKIEENEKESIEDEKKSFEKKEVSSAKGDESRDPLASGALDTSKINIPSNLHEILANIKKKEEAIREKENEIKRRLNLPDDDTQDGPSGSSSSKDVDLRLLLGSGKDQDLRVFTRPTRPPLPPQVPQLLDQDLRTRDPRIPRDSTTRGGGGDPDKVGPTLSKMSDADLVAKATEMEKEEGLLGSKSSRYPRGGGVDPAASQFQGVVGGPHPQILHPPNFRHSDPYSDDSSGPPPPPAAGRPLPMMGPPRGPPQQYGPDQPPMMAGGPPSGPSAHPPHGFPGPVGPPHGPPGLHVPPGASHGPPGPHGPPGLHGPPVPQHYGGPMSMRGGPVPPDEFHHAPYNHPPSMDDRLPPPPPPPQSRGGHWDSRGHQREQEYWGPEDGWDRERGGSGWRSRSGGDRYYGNSNGRKRRWKEGGGGKPSSKGRWGDGEDDWTQGREGRSSRKNGGGKRPRSERSWRESEVEPNEIDY